MLPLRILVVGKEDAAVRDLESALARLDFSIAGICRDEASIRHAARLYRPDVVLVDIPPGQGAEAVDGVARLQFHAGAALVLLAGEVDREVVTRAAGVHLYDCLVKPFHRHELRHILEVAYARHASRAQLQASGEQFAATLRSMAECVISTDIMGGIAFMNPAAEAITSWSLTEAAGRPLQDVFRVTRPDGEALDSPDLVNGDPGSQRTILLTDRHGRTVAVEDSTTPIRDASGAITGLVIVFRRRDGAHPFAGTNGDGGDAGDWPNLPGIVGSIADPLLALDSEWRITCLNSMAASVLEGRREALIGSVIWDCLPPSVRRNCFAEFAAALRDREPRSFELEYEARNLWMEVQLYPYGDGLLALLRDITGRKEAGERRKKLEQLESLGLLARGFAHDFNNLLTVLLGNLSLAEKSLPPNASGHTELRHVRKASAQAQNLVQQLLTFARGGVPIRQAVDLGSLVRDWYSEWPKRQDLEYRADFPDQPVPASVDRHQIRRLLSNLLKNAEQSMRRGGAVTVSLAERDGRVSIDVADTGEGIPPGAIARVFEPFFTTRDDANSSGLGLTVCESIAGAHGGTIRISPTPAGTRVTFSIPASSPAEPAAPAAPPSNGSAPARRGRRVLILEDEPLIRHLMVRNLEGAGCEVTATADGADTITRYRQAMENGDRFDLVVMDLSIPGGTGGAQAMEKIRQIDPEVCAIVSSGYSDDPVMSRYPDYGFRAVLPKPYQPSELRELVEEMLH